MWKRSKEVRSSPPRHSSAEHLLVPHLNTFVTPSMLHSSPSFPNRDSTSFKISLGSTSTPAIPERQRDKSSHAHNPLSTLALANDIKTLYWGLSRHHQLTLLYGPNGTNTHLQQKTGPGIFAKKLLRKTRGTKRDPAPSGNNEHKCWWFHEVDNMENSE